MTRDFTKYTKENGGRVIVLLLLFIISLYQLHSMGLVGMALVCSLPILFVGLLLVFQYKMASLWTIFIINYIVMGFTRYYPIPVPVTGLTLFPQILLLMVCITNI